MLKTFSRRLGKQEIFAGLYGQWGALTEKFVLNVKYCLKLEIICVDTPRDDIS